MSNDHLKMLTDRLPELESCADDIAAAFALLRDCFRAGNKAMLCGNGGSAADCEHWSGEMLKGFEGDRPVSAAMRARLGDGLADKLQGALPVIPLPGFLSLSSAYANDCHSAYIFAQLTLALGSAGDVLVAISTSGNSENVLYAVETAQALDLKVLGLTGGSGGRLKDLCDVCITAPINKTYRIQELHLPIYHSLALMLEQEFFGD
jgi:D-sedoheptulose 7-phosphate isomerase